tara:strand:- start:4879 stop:5343 length:465 start_codon:yes stop_codon:yes gene_type:complete
MRIVTGIAGMVGGAFLAGCVTPAQSFQFDNSRTVDAGFDQTWERTIGVLASNNLPVKTLEKASGLIVAENELVSFTTMGEAASCPASPLITPIGGIMNYNIFVRKLSETQTTVAVNTKYNMRYRDMNSAIVSDTCNSNGNVERKLLNAISGVAE